MTDTRRIDRIGYYGILAMFSWLVSMIVSEFDLPWDLVEALVQMFQEPVIAIVIWILIAVVLEAFIFD